MKKLERFNYSVETRSGRNCRKFYLFVDAFNYCLEMSKSYNECFYLVSFGSLTVTSFYHGRKFDSTEDTYDIR